MAENTVEVNIELAIRNATRDIANIEKKLDSFAKNTEDGFKKAGSASKIFIGNLAAIGASKALGLATDAARKFFDVFIVGGIQAAQVQEDAINALNIALKATGEFSISASEDLQAFAAQLQQNSKFGDEAVINNMALIQSLADLDSNGLKRATQATADLAAGLQIDLRSAATLVGKGLAGEVGTFSRYGLSIKKGATEAETMANVLNAVEERFSGAAKGQIETYSGAIAQASNSFGDLTEKTGELITKNEFVIKAVNAANAEFVRLGEVVSANKAVITDFIVNGLFGLADSLVMILKVSDATGRMFKGVFQAMKIAVTLVMTEIAGVVTVALAVMENTIGKGFELLGKENPFTELRQTAQEFAKAGLGEIVEQGKEIGKTFSEEGSLGKVADYIDRTKEGFEQVYEASKSTTDKIVENETAAAAKKKDLANSVAAAKKKADEDAATAAIALAQKEQDAKAAIAGQLVSLSKNLTSIIFQDQKTAAYVTAGINVAEGITKALGTYPPPFGAIAAGIVAANGAIEVAKISSATFATGGIVGGTSTQGDKVQARLNSGEMVLTTGQQANLFRQANVGGGGNSSSIVINNPQVDSDSRINQLIKRIKDAQQFNNAPRFAVA